jgi:hypothetical protein
VWKNTFDVSELKIDFLCATHHTANINSSKSFLCEAVLSAPFLCACLYHESFSLLCACAEGEKMVE